MRFSKVLLSLIVLVATFGIFCSEEIANVTIDEFFAAVDGVVDSVPITLPESTSVPEQAVESLEDSERIEDASEEPVGLLGLGGLLGGGNTEFLLDQLDEATAELSKLKEDKANLAITLGEKEIENSDLRAQLVSVTIQLSELGGVIHTLNQTLTALEIDRAGSSELSKQLEAKFQEEIQALQEKVRVAERNATLLENRAHYARNEKNMAKLSQENCLLELEATRHTQLDEVEALRAELSALKKAKPALCMPSPAGKHTERVGSVQSTDASASTVVAGCDSSRCFDLFVARYLFFWADEHRARAKSDASQAPSAGDKTRGRGEQGVDVQSSAMKDALDSEIVQKSASYALSAYAWCAQTYTRYAHPYVWKFLLIEAKIASAAASLVVRLVSTTWTEVLSPLLFNVLAPAGQDLYSTQVLPFFMSNVYPWYKTNLEVQVNRAYASAAATWEKDYEAWFDHNVLDVTDFVIGRLHYVSYFTVRFFSSENLLADLQDVLVYLQGFIPSVIEQVSSMPALHTQLGEHARLAVTVLVYTCVGLFAYIIRRVLLGIVSLVLIVVLSPLLLVVYCLAKLAKPFLPKKKSAKKAAARPAKGAPTGAVPAVTSAATAPPRAARSTSAGGPNAAVTAPPLAPLAAGYGIPRPAAAQTKSQQPDSGKSTVRVAPMPSTTTSQGSVYNDITPSGSQEWNAYEP